jgi:hypothetical protein
MVKQTFPDFVPPMMAESAKTPFDSPEWIFEIKLDGYRAITTYSPLRRAKVGPRKKVGIVGSGGLGHMGKEASRSFAR